MPKARIKVLIVDDSLLVRATLSHVLAQAEDIEVVGGATDPYQARELIIEHRPDVIILDIEMPRMDGLTFLGKLRAHYPVPVIICSSVAPANGQKALDAIEAGAIEVIAKPSQGGRAALSKLGEELAEKVRAAAMARPTAPPIARTPAAAPVSLKSQGLNPRRCVVVIGASTGGTEAIKEVLSGVPSDFPPVAIVQHMPAEFTRSFAERLDQHSALRVTEAADDEVLEPGRAFVARGDRQMSVVVGANGLWRINYGTDELINRHCPSVDVLFDSAAKNVGPRAVGILLTGMGTDGAKGLLGMRQAGAVTICQDEKSSIVYGMPKAAYDLGAAQHSLSLEDIPGAVIKALSGNARAVSAVG